MKLNIQTRQALRHLRSQVEKQESLDIEQRDSLLACLEHVKFSCVEFDCQAEEKGFNHFLQGGCFTSNPYLINSIEAKHWEDGWYAPIRYKFVRLNISQYRPSH